MPKLTKRTVDDAMDEAEKSGVEVFHWDSLLAGFGFRAKASRVGAFIMQYRTRERITRRMTIGRYGTLTLDQARKKAKRLLGDASLGGDPAQEKKEASTGPTIAELARRYMREHCAGRCKSTTLAQHEWLLSKFILPEFGQRKVRALTRQDIERAHHALRPTRYNANRMLGLLKTMLSHAEHWGWRDPGTNPARLIRKFTEHRRQRYLSSEELRRLNMAIAHEEAAGTLVPSAAAALRLLMLTGCRLNEILTLPWTAVDLERSIIQLERHKTDAKGIKGVPLNKQAVAVLRGISRAENNPFVIAGKTPGRLPIPMKPPRHSEMMAPGIPT
jgi:integrase